MTERKTILSHDRVYRYTLWREWPAPTPNALYTEDPHLDYYPGKHDQYVNFIGLNPSKADENVNDRTINRCIAFAKSWGFGSLCMTNLFAFRATRPRDMLKAINPVGDANMGHVVSCASNAGMVIAAWGNDGFYMNMDLLVFYELEELGIPMHHLGLTGLGKPKHPLYLKKTTKPTRWLQQHA